MRVWIVGSNGFIGRHLAEKLKQVGLTFFTTSKDGHGADFGLDLVRESTFTVLPLKPNDIVVLLAGESSPEVCQNKFEESFKVNVVGTKAFIKTALNAGARVLFASSDTVYGEQQEPVEETSPCSPIGSYGQMKLEVEEAFRLSSNFGVFRLSYVVGDSDRFTNFLKSQSGQVEEVEAYSDLIRNTISINVVVEGLLRIFEDWTNMGKPRVINFGGPISESRVDLALRIISEHRLNLGVKAVSAPLGFFDFRPRVISISNKKLANLMGRLGQTNSINGAK